MNYYAPYFLYLYERSMINNSNKVKIKRLKIKWGKEKRKYREKIYYSLFSRISPINIQQSNYRSREAGFRLYLSKTISPLTGGTNATYGNASANELDFIIFHPRTFQIIQIKIRKITNENYSKRDRLIKRIVWL